MYVTPLLIVALISWNLVLLLSIVSLFLSAHVKKPFLSKGMALGFVSFGLYAFFLLRIFSLR